MLNGRHETAAFRRICVLNTRIETTVKESSKLSGTLCPVSRSQAIVGDRWSLVIMRELFMGNRRFDSLMAQTQATPQMLATRLKKLEKSGMIRRKPYMVRPPRYEYHCTEMGQAFYPIIRALREWGENWCKSKGEPITVRYTHKSCEGNAGLGAVCETCGELLTRADLIPKLSAPYASERAAREAA
ncbi:helix-turn-helix transcriptional regulator [Paraburkholderia bengalensis]|uniref:Helix-turn-helix transcriptional regulator n=1 Tax=Paraburkholderia bengalensis TaxID=2747562 RepID=A0ABU8IZV7_9BURK